MKSAFGFVRCRLVGVVFVAAVLLPPPAMATEPPRRIVSVGGPVTEIVFALGAGPRVVGVDTSSLVPAAVASLPKVGYQRSLSAEGVLSLAPDLLIAGDEAGPPAALEQVRAAGVTVLVVPTARSVGVFDEAVRELGRALAREDAAAAVLERVGTELEQAASTVAHVSSRPRVLFLYARGAGTVLVAGRDTAPQALIDLAGGVNAVDNFAGFRPLSAEAVVLADPDVLLVSDDGLASLGGTEGLLALPGVGATRAAAARRIARLDDAHLLGFGPRVGEAVAALIRQFHPEAVP